MKDKKASKGSVLQDSDRKKSSFEKFENEVKSAVFNVLYVLLKEEDSSFWKHIIIILLDFIQIYYYSFSPLVIPPFLLFTQINYPWKGTNVLNYWQMFLEFFQINYWLAKLNSTTYLVFFYICVSFICLVILDIFYVSYSYSRKKLPFMWPLQALRTVAGLISTVIFLPILDTFTTMIHCESSDGIYVNWLYSDLQCWTGVHIIHATIAILTSILFIVICTVVSLTYYDSQSSSQNPTARVNSRAETFIMFMKIVFVYLYAFFESDQYQWFLIVILLAMSFVAFANYQNAWPYFNDRMNRLKSVLTCLFVWANFILFVCKVLEYSQFNGGLQLYYLGLPLIVALIIFEKDDRSQILLKNINNFQRGEDISLQIRYFLHLIQTKDQDRKSAIMLKGYIYHHEDTCPNKDCHLKQYKAQVIQLSKTKRQGKKITQQSQNSDHFQLLLQHAKNMYKQGIQKFPDCTPLKINYAFFLMEKMNRKVEALQELSHASNFNPPVDEQFVIYRYKKISEDFGDGFGDAHGGAMDMVAKFAYDAAFKQLQIHVEKSAQLHFEFWSYLREDRPDIGKLNECGSKINQSIVHVESYWNQLQKLNSNNPKALRFYAKFLIDILNDKEAGQDLMVRAKDAQNVKQNVFDGNNFAEDLNDINTISSNGTPCIYVTGDSDKIGLVTQCNSGASRIFGYTVSEMKNHNVEKLMPEMYAKNHSRVLDDALAKGPENIPNKERLVFARHKSGYIFPVWLQLKMVNTTQQGIQFVALFKVDKKIMSSNIAFILLNKEKKIHGISSSCMKMLGLDIPKMRKLIFSGIDISKLAPDLFSDSLDNNYLQKSGATLDWYLPEFENQKSKIPQQKQGARAHSRIYQDNDIKVSQNKIQFICHLNPIVMGELGEIGWYLKLESLTGAKITGIGIRKERQKDKLKQPLFQFRYEPQNGRFIRELRDNLFTDNASKNPNFVNGQWKTFEDEREQSPVNAQASKQEPNKVGNDEDKKDEEKVEVKPQENEDLFSLKRRWGAGIPIYRLTDGKFLPKDYDEEQKKQQEIEEERKKKQREEENSSATMDLLKNNIKSRKALQIAINDKSTPRAIRNLRVTMNLVIMCLLALAITEFVIINGQFQAINQNFNLIQQSYGRIAEIQRIAYDVRSIVLINEGKETAFQNYTTQPDYVAYLKSDISSALNNLYSLQNSISLTSLTMSSQQDTLINTKVVNLYFMDSDLAVKVLNFSLSEAVLQIASGIFTVQNLNTTQFTDTQQDIFFVLYNVFNDFLIDIQKSSLYYVQDLDSRAQQKNSLIMILFFTSLSILLLTMLLLFPVVSSVNKARMKVLSLFVDIPNYHVIALSNRCEKFLSCMHEDQNEDIDSEDGEAGTGQIDDPDYKIAINTRRGGHKIAKNSAKSSKTFFIQFGIAVLVISSYFVAMFILSLDYIKNIQSLNSEMNIICQAEPQYTLTQNVIREMILNASKPILNNNSFTVAKDSIENAYGLNQQILTTHNGNSGIDSPSYNSQFQNTYEGDLCTIANLINITLLPYDCETYLAGSPSYGLQTVLARYIETLKYTLNAYVLDQQNGTNVQSLYNSQYFEDLYIMEFRFIKNAFRSFITALTNMVNASYTSLANTRMAAFVVFIIGLVMSYLILWTPFVNRLNNEIWRTKSMLTIIPIDVILKIPRIQEFLNNQSFFSSKIGSNGTKIKKEK